MPYQEKSAWIMLALAAATSIGYFVAIWLRGRGIPIAEVEYVGPMLWSIVISIGASIVAHSVVGAFARRGERRKDQRDSEIGRFGEYTGQSLLVIGAVVALLLAMTEVHYFWIANTLYLGFVLSAVLGSVAKICAYRFGLPRW